MNMGCIGRIIAGEHGAGKAETTELHGLSVKPSDILQTIVQSHALA